MRKWLTPLFLFLFIGACAMPETKIYRLYLPMERERPIPPKGDASIVIMINSPRHLSQPYIVSKNSPYQLEISKYSKWETSPTEIMLGVFKDTLSSDGRFKEVRAINIVPDGFYSLKIDLKRFERFDTENDSFGELAFDVRLLFHDGKVLYQQAISKRIKLEDRSFLSLAKGLSRALAEGVEQVRENINRSLKEGNL
jgi:ABC-type uncharacterized transport system auxiliary subunit